MIKVKNPDPIFLEGNDHAILLLHTFTGTVRDVKQLGTYLNKQGFTVLIPSYPGHGLPIQDFVKYDINDWFQTVEESYLQLKENYDTISLVGVSLGGLFSLKLAEIYDVNQLIVMSVPMKKDPEGIKYRLRQFAPRMHKVITHEPYPETNNKLIDDYQGAQTFVDFIDDIMSNLDQIKNPTTLLYGDLDDKSYHESAQFIYDNINAPKHIDHYVNAGHLMTTSSDKYILFEDIYRYLK
ncbi:alpha/beta hydrolase [Macrococcus animalis]|uniref:alpha/beta hydrolase n=1 Tax=Macrococcus animalis TaxID=3395467 RepID=UPI0039BDEC69